MQLKHAQSFAWILSYSKNYSTWIARRCFCMLIQTNLKRYQRQIAMTRMEYTNIPIKYISNDWSFDVELWMNEQRWNQFCMHLALLLATNHSSYSQFIFSYNANAKPAHDAKTFIIDEKTPKYSDLSILTMMKTAFHHSWLSCLFKRFVEDWICHNINQRITLFTSSLAIY